MNRMNRRAYALLLTVTVAAVNAAYAMENEVVEVVLTEQQSEAVVSNAWYKKSSIQIAAAVVTCVAGVYAVGTYMNKVSSPVALWRNLFMPVLPQTINANVINNGIPADTTNSSSADNNIIDDQNSNNGNSSLIETHKNVPVDEVKSNDSTNNLMTSNDQNVTVVDTAPVMISEKVAFAPITKKQWPVVNLQVIKQKFYDTVKFMAQFRS